jgi:hypothetical protein
MRLLSESEFVIRQQIGDLPDDLSYQEYVEIEKKQQEVIAARRAAMHPLDREVLERHEARRRCEAERRAA